MSLQFSKTNADKNTSTFILTIKPTAFVKETYTRIKAMLESRLDEVSDHSLKSCYNDALLTTHIVEYVHEHFATKMDSLFAHYNRIKKVPFQHGLINKLPYSDYVFHASEYQGNSISLNEKTNSVGKQLSLFIDQFLATYNHIYDNEALDKLVYWTETLCFDAQIEGRYFNSLSLQYIEASLRSDEKEKSELLKIILPLSKKMAMLPSDCCNKIVSLAESLSVDVTIIENIKAEFKNKSNYSFKV